MEQTRENHYDRTYAEIYLDRIRRNVENARRLLKADKKFCVVLKTDAYGHGAPAVAWAVDDLVDYYAVATVEEGAVLRRHGIQKPILNLGVVPPSDYALMIRERIMPTVFTVEQAQAISAEAGRLGTTAEVHLALDTGMGRIGILTEEEGAEDTALAIAAAENIRIAGMYTHFASADEKDKSFALEQYCRFRNFAEKLEKRGLHIPIRHCANSAGIMEQIGTDFDMVRDGICVYGIYPSNEVDRGALPLLPALEWKARISYIKTVPAGYPVSYGSTFRAPHRMEIATVPVGYGDGYPRLLSGQGEVLIHGKRCPVLGRVCMDQFMADVSGLNASAGDQATLLGRDGDAEYTLYDMEKCGCFTYEVLCGIGKRVPRVYISQDRIVGMQDAFREVYPDFVRKSADK